MKRKHLLKTLALSAATAALLTSVSHAQEEDAEQVEETVIVTGTALSKLDVPLSETPQNISIIDQEQFELQGATSIEEALRYTPAFQGENAGRSGFDAFLVRGFDQSRYQFRDGLRLDPGFLNQQEPGGLSSIEVVKGPASVLYGQISPGGIVNMTSRVASPDRVTDVSATIGTDDFYRAALDIGGAINGSGTVSARAPIVFRSRGDTQDFVEAERIYASPSITWQPTPDTSLSILALYQEDSYDRTIGAPFVGTVLPSPAGPIDRELFLGEPSVGQLESEQAQIGYIFSHNFTDNIQFRSRTRYSDFSLDGPIVQAPRPGSTPTSINRRGFDFVGDRTMFTTDNQVEAVFDQGTIEHRVMVGIDYQDYRDENSADLFGLDPIDPNNPVYGGQPTPLGPFFAIDAGLEQLGIYAQYRAQIDDRWILLAGVRQSESDTDQIFVFGTTVITPDDTPVTQSDDDTSFNVALMYTSDTGFSPYLSFSQSFEPQFGFDPLTNGDTPPPSQGEQIEAGLRWASSDNRLSAQGALFEIDLTNIVNGDPDNPGFSILVGEQRHRGAEFELSGQVTDFVEVQAAYTYLDAEIVTSNNGDEGLVPPNAPENAASLFLTVDGDAFGLGNSSGSVGVRYVGERRIGGPNEILPDFTVVDAALRHDFGQFGVDLNVKNLFDEEYFSGGDFRSVFFGEGRQVQLTLRTSF